jgi:hypothetical protein
MNTGEHMHEEDMVGQILNSCILHIECKTDLLKIRWYRYLQGEYCRSLGLSGSHY